MRRWLALIFVIFCSMMVVVYETSASDKRFFLPEPLGGVKIVLDAGHGGMDGGASGGEVIEKEITLAITKKVERQLTRLGAEVILTRQTDGDVISEQAANDQKLTNRERKKQDIFLRESLVNSHEPDLFVTIHANAIPNAKWRGAQVFFHKDGHPNSELLAKAIQQTLRETLENTDREALSIKQVYLLKKADAPAALVETGFISNEEERKLLATDSYQEKIAFAIARGIENYIHLNID
ncbi:MAG: N-acetylmuramoyl-L-alanine amidase [Solibacillus sp.]